MQLFWFLTLCVSLSISYTGNSNQHPVKNLRIKGFNKKKISNSGTFFVKGLNVLLKIDASNFGKKVGRQIVWIICWTSWMV